MKKYLAVTDYSDLGRVLDTKEQAEAQATAYRDWSDNMTGYYRMFGKHSKEPQAVKVIEDLAPNAEQYLQAIKEMKAEQEKIDAEIERMRKERLGKYYELIDRYVNLNTEYNHHDFIEVTYLHNGRKRTQAGIVYDVWVKDSGEIRPKLGRCYDDGKDEIVSIRIINRREGMTDKEIFCKLHAIR